MDFSISIFSSIYQYARESDFTDILSTLAAIIGDDLADFDPSDSQNFGSVLRGHPSADVRKETVIADNVLIQGEWKYIRGNASGWLLRKSSGMPSAR